MIKQRLEQLEKQIGSYPLDILLLSLVNYMYKCKEKDSLIGFGCHWIVFIAIANKDLQKNSASTHPSKVEFLEWSKALKQIFDMLIKPEYCIKNTLKGFREIPDTIKKWGIINEDNWKNIFPYLPTMSHFREINTHTLSNFTCNPTFPIVRSYELTQLFIKDLNQDLAKKLTEHIQNQFFGMNLETLHFNLYKISYFFVTNNGVIKETEIIKLVQDQEKNRAFDPEQSDWTNPSKDIISLLNFLSITYDEISNQYKKTKDTLFQQETMLVNDNPFIDKPLYKTSKDNETIYICPSISLFNMRLETMLIRVVDMWCDNLVKQEENSVKNIGISRESFLNKRITHHKDLFIHDGIVRLDKDKETEAQRYLEFKHEAFNSLSKADFIVETPENIVIIECKNSLGIWRPFYEDRDKYYESLDRIKKALDQCNKTHSILKSDRKTKHVFHIVVCNENVWIEGAIVGLILHLGQKHNSTSDKVKELLIKPGNYSILSIAAFDFLLNTNTLDKFIKECRDNAKLFDSEIEDDEAYNLIIKSINNIFEYPDAINEKSLKYSEKILKTFN